MSRTVCSAASVSAGQDQSEVVRVTSNAAFPRREGRLLRRPALVHARVC
ncbi:hypothetical protein [Kibdelosporangium philippinense]